MPGIASTELPFPRSLEFPVPPQVTLVGQRDLEGMALAEALVCETHLAALQTATVTSALNALRHSRRMEEPELIDNFVPQHTPMLLATRSWLAEAGLEAATIELIELFFAEIRTARLQLSQFKADADEIGWQRAELLHRPAAIAGWKRACYGAAGAVKALDAEFRLALPERYAESVPILTSLLNSAAEGLQPCVDIGGRPFLPELPQRRLAARRALYQQCTVQHARRTVRALVRDVSPGGLGLDGVSELKPQELVVIDLATGRRFTGIVVWVKGRLAGVRLSTPLPPNDPLLFG